MPSKQAAAWAAVLMLGFIGKVGAQAPAHPLLPMCGACHGTDGNASVPGVPSLAGQPRVFIENQLVMIREGMREVPQMKGLLDSVKDEDFTALAMLYAKMPPKLGGLALNTDKAKRGADISKRALCGSCHLPDYAGQQQIPRLAGQREDFLFANMKQFRDGKAIGRDTVMMATLRGMSDTELSDLAHYFATAGMLAK
jgi:cytochrome c553